MGKHSWHIVASKCGAKASGVLYSIAETSKANGLKPFDYLKYLLDSILEHLDDPPSEYLDELMHGQRRYLSIAGELKIRNLAASIGGIFSGHHEWFTIYD